MTDYNPVRIEQAISECANKIAQSVPVCGERYTEFRTAERQYDLAYARAYVNANGPAHEKRYQATLATETEREKLDVADAAYRFADREAKAAEAELRAIQSLGASVRQAYDVVGRRP